ncbi:MAG: hypothetical protein ABW098_14090 [Candidatus Thiodiazotropha sp.]
MDAIDMKKLHLGCGESLQPKFPGFSIFRPSMSVGMTVGQRHVPKALGHQKKRRREESDYR